ncbi:MAG TPA: hypothetical protein VMS31_10635, partial [Pyrinomonadaceae bacterium]|nr:hypothetical protein [Pyrinomonadaceae bacterium]
MSEIVKSSRTERKRAKGNEEKKTNERIVKAISGWAMRPARKKKALEGGNLPKPKGLKSVYFSLPLSQNPFSSAYAAEGAVS